MSLNSPPTVVIIDDEPDSCLLWKAFLTQLQYNVFTALTLREGLALLDSVRPDVIFLDNNLPDGLGWDHLGEIRDRSRLEPVRLRVHGHERRLHGERPRDP